MLKMLPYILVFVAVLTELTTAKANLPDDENIFPLTTYGSTNRTKRQVCLKKQFLCQDGTCISSDGRCDGVTNCPDGSDETHALCRSVQCQKNLFRCTYGACVDATAPCDGVQDCADNSDEVSPICRNGTLEEDGMFNCTNGETIPAADYCDGSPDCADGSDETLTTCAAVACLPHLFQCAYGACVDGGSDCDGVQDCADGSDEDGVLCSRKAAESVTVKPRRLNSRRRTQLETPPQNKCVLPPYPENGSYTVVGNPNALPGDIYSTVFLNITCDPGLEVLNGKTSAFCYEGFWSDVMPKCVQFCRLHKHPSVEYHCFLSGSLVTSRICGPQEPPGTMVKPVCKTPNYYYTGVLSYMKCSNGNWDYVATCKPECGTITPEGIQLIIGGKPAYRGELPWHAGIYTKTTTPYMQICGGSLISTTVIISAAHCFWSDVDKLLPASDYLVAVGKIYRPWNNPNDADVQKSEVAEIKLTPYFRGAATNFQDDIALVIVSSPFTYQVFIRPVCLDFDVNFDKLQLSDGSSGKVAGWGLVARNGNASQVLKVVELPFVNIDRCYGVSPMSFREYITSDKICAGYTNGTTLCQGDSGGGLAFPSNERGALRYYLRGVVSTAPKNADLCTASTLTTFTQITKHEHFIKQSIHDLL